MPPQMQQQMQYEDEVSQHTTGPMAVVDPRMTVS